MSEIRKALAPLVLAAVAVAVQYWQTGAFSTSQELVTALLGVAAAVAVYVSRNLPSDPAKKAVAAIAASIVAVVVQLISTGHVEDWGELVTAVLGLVTSLAVYYVPNVARGAIDRVA
jgi:peptidoglycan/LPS O-acetylase OafA/YrhL